MIPLTFIASLLVAILSLKELHFFFLVIFPCTFLASSLCDHAIHIAPYPKARNREKGFVGLGNY